MWASSARYQCSNSNKLRSLHWTQAAPRSSEEHEDQDYNYVNAGWLAAGCEEGNVGINWVSSSGGRKYTPRSTFMEKNYSGFLYKSNFNLRGHVGEVKIARWKPGGSRLATYDSWGNLKIWKSRANVLAINNELTTTVAIKDIQWSSCGHYIAICGEDGHLQLYSGFSGANVFSVQVLNSSQWSNSYAQFTSISWDSNGTRLAVGTERGEVMDVDTDRYGQFIKTTIIRQEVPVIYVKYYGAVQEFEVQRGGVKSYVQSLSAYLANGEVAIFQNLASNRCSCIYTGITNGQAQWNSNESLLAIVGYYISGNTLAARFMDAHGNITFSINQLLPIQPTTDIALQSICWALDDTVLFIANNKDLYSIDVYDTMPSLLQICREYIVTHITEHNQAILNHLPLPHSEIKALNITSPTLIVPSIDLTTHSSLVLPLPSDTRLHCIMVPIVESASSTGAIDTYVLKYEHFGSYVPMLRGKQRSGRFFNVGFEICQEFCNNEVTNCRMSCRSPVTEVDSKPVIAEIEGNTLTKHYKFKTQSTLIATLNITSHYMRCLPRDLTLTICSPMDNQRETLVSKRPQWNPNFGIFELDFGGRINRDSVKNFQIEYNGNVVYQFGKSVFGHYCLDFQSPFSPIVAFSVALASVV